MPFRVAHRETFGAKLSETTGAISVEPWVRATKELRLGLEAGLSGASRPNWPDLYQRDMVTGALGPTDRYSYLAWRGGAQLWYRPAPHHNVRAHYRYVAYDYVRDPTFDPALDPMHLTPRDDTQHQLDASWRYVREGWAVAARADWTRTAYDTLLARQARTGQQSPTGALQVLSKVEPGFEVELRKIGGSRADLSFQYGYEVQDDPYQGYYSLTGHHPRVVAKVAVTDDLSARARYEGWYRTYGPSSSTRLEPGATRRDDSRTVLAGEASYRLAGNLSARVELEWITRSTNFRDYVPNGIAPDYDIKWDYTNLWVLGGLEYKL